MLNTDKTRKLNALLSRADELIEEGHLREALEVARKARDLDPRPEVLCLEGGLLAELGEVEGAISVFESVLDRDRDNLEAMGALADLLIYGGSGEPEEVERGLALCRRAMKLARGDEELQAELSLLEGIALSGLGAYAEALGSLERAQKVLGEDPELLQELGIVLFHLWRFDDARKVFERLLEREPHAPHGPPDLGVPEARQPRQGRRILPPRPRDRSRDDPPSLPHLPGGVRPPGRGGALRASGEGAALPLQRGHRGGGLPAGEPVRRRRDGDAFRARRLHRQSARGRGNLRPLVPLPQQHHPLPAQPGELGRLARGAGRGDRHHPAARGRSLPRARRGRAARARDRKS